jgi:UrcA family protein
MLKQSIVSSLTVALAMAAFAAPAAHAQSAQAPSITVSVGGIDAKTEGGARIVLQRIKNAAGQVCGGQPDAPLDRLMTFQPCVEEVTQRTVAGLGNVQLTALLEKNGAPRLQSVASAR